MKTQWLLIVALGFLGTHAETGSASEPIDLILLAGQSNAVGYDAKPSELPPSPLDKEILFWWRCGDPPPDEFDVTSRQQWSRLGPQPRGMPKQPRGGRQYGNFAQVEGGFGPEMGLGRTLYGQTKTRRLAIVKVAFSGTGLGADWNPADEGDGGACYRALVKEAKLAATTLKEEGAEFRWRAFAWVQGESDANAKDAPLYAERLAAMIAALRKDLNAPQLPALVALNTRFGGGSNTFVARIVEAQKSLTTKDTRVRYVDTSDAPIANGAHFNSQGTLDVGKMFAETLVKLEKELAVRSTSATAADSEVRLSGSPGQWQLLRNGEPYFVRGVGGDGDLELLAKLGGNSLRTWGDEKLGETLDAAHKLGLTVTAGIWLGQVRQGFDWTDAASLRKQREHVREVVQKYQRHPALLAWALGNEMEDPEGRNAAVWSEINNLARMVKTLDARHPTMTVIAELGGDKVKNLHEFCPDLDLIGINSYAGAASVGKRYRQLGGAKPYLLTEFGPAGIWETNKDDLGAFPELSSTQKATSYRTAYREAILGQSGVCLGSYAFYWGSKQEVTSTWFSLLTRDGARLEAVDVLQEFWTGRAPANRCPTIQGLKLDVVAQVSPGQKLRADLQAADVDGDSLKTSWLVQFDPEEYGTGGDREETPMTFPDAVTRGDAAGAELVAPANGGLYRLFVVVKDGQGGAAVANVAFRVAGPARKEQGRAVKLPLNVYAEDGERSEFAPAGWMGNAKAIKLDPAHADRPQSGKTCLKCEFRAEQGWGGVVWQSPANDWGDRRGGCDLTGAKRLTFWARGETGAEVVSFSFGIIGREKRYFDTAKGELPKVSLTRDWKQYEIPVQKFDLSRIKTGFVWTAESAGRDVVFFLDDIRWEP